LYNTFILPEQWNEAIDYLKEATEKPEFKVNDWIVTEGQHEIMGQIFDMPGNNIVHFQTVDGALAEKTEELRHATKEEIYNHLIKQTDIKVGDKVFQTDKVYTVERIELYSMECEKTQQDELSWSATEYYEQYGDHLIIRDSIFTISLPKVKKVYDSSNKFANFTVQILKEYAIEKGITVRSTSDLSKLEEWLLIKLFYKE